MPIGWAGYLFDHLLWLFLAHWAGAIVMLWGLGGPDLDASSAGTLTLAALLGAAGLSALLMIAVGVDGAAGLRRAPILCENGVYYWRRADGSLRALPLSAPFGIGLVAQALLGAVFLAAGGWPHAQEPPPGGAEEAELSRPVRWEPREPLAEEAGARPPFRPRRNLLKALVRRAAAAILIAAALKAGLGVSAIVAALGALIVLLLAP